jgi:hypothetical protein
MKWRADRLSGLAPASVNGLLLAHQIGRQEDRGHAEAVPGRPLDRRGALAATRTGGCGR